MATGSTRKGGGAHKKGSTGAKSGKAKSRDVREREYQDLDYRERDYDDREYKSSETRGGSSRSGSAASKRRAAQKKKAKQRRRIILFAVEIVALLVLGVVIWSVQTVTKMDRIVIDEGDIVINEHVEENTEMKGYRNIALFGVDSRKGKLGKGQRTDTIMIASINMDTKQVKLCSVYRDTYLNLGNDSYNKANAAYAKGGAEQALTMLNWNFDLNIKEYMTVGFDGLIETIDSLGGIEIDVHENEIRHLNNYQMSMFSEDENDPLNENIVKVTSPGLQTLNGLQATAYCRIRAVGDDYGRTERQRKVIMACLEKAKTVNPLKLVEIVNNVAEHVVTNLDITEIASIVKDAANYEVVAQDGVPFASNRGSGNLGKIGSSVVPLDLTENVRLLHKFLFDVEDYEPSEQVKKYSNKIASDISQYNIR